MTRSVYTNILVVLIALVFSGCYNANRIVVQGCNQKYVSNEWILKITEAAGKPSIGEQLRSFEALVSSQSCKNDPVLYNYYGLSLIRSGYHQEGFKALEEAALLIQTGILQQSLSESSTSRLTHTITRSGNRNASNEALILRIFREHFDSVNSQVNQQRHESELVEALMERPGFPPFPPYFPESGSAGVIIEILNEIYPNHFRPEFIWYVQPEQDKQYALENMLAAVKSNMILAGILSKDSTLLNQALEDVYQIHTTNITTRSKIALGFYINRQDPTMYTSRATKSLFR